MGVSHKLGSCWQPWARLTSQPGWAEALGEVAAACAAWHCLQQGVHQAGLGGSGHANGGLTFGLKLRAGGG